MWIFQLFVWNEEPENESRKINSILTNKYDKEDYIRLGGLHGRRYSICD